MALGMVAGCGPAAQLPTPEASPEALAATAPVDITTATPSASTQTASPTPEPTLQPTFTVEVVAPTTVSAVPALQALALQPPLLVDEGHGLVYASAETASGPVTVAVSASDGALQAVYPAAGGLALDTVRDRLFVDGEAGLTAFSLSITDETEAIVALPAGSGAPGQTNPAPQADPKTGTVLAFRDNIMYFVDPGLGEVTGEAAFDLRSAGDCRSSTGPLPISRSFYDPDARIAYLDFVTYVCTPWIGHTVVAYDLDEGREIARKGLDPFLAAVGHGRLYVASWHRFGIGTRAVWRDGLPRHASTGWSGMASRLVPDPGRGLVYESHAGDIRVFDAGTLDLLGVASSPQTGTLVAYDAVSDQLYFLEEGRLRVALADSIAAPSPRPPEPKPPPAVPVDRLTLSPDWPADGRLMAVWGAEQPAGDCYAFAQLGGRLLLGTAGEDAWAEPVAGLPGMCRYVTALALSPGYPQDGTIFAGLAGYGLFRSQDFGHSWEPAGAGLPEVGVREVMVSPGFARDGTLFAWLRGGELVRSQDASQDAGGTWESVGAGQAVAMSPEFDVDGVVVAAATRQAEGASPPLTDILVSAAGGEWETVGQAPVASVEMLSVAPLFQRWGVAFLYGQGTLYRTADGGRTWTPVLTTEVGSWRQQLAYGIGVEENRPVYLLLVRRTEGPDPWAEEGTLYRSSDGGLTWQRAVLPDGSSPTALVVSPRFAEDRQLVVGTSDGRILSVTDGELVLR